MSNHESKFDDAFMRELRVGLAVIAILLLVFVYVAIGRFSGWYKPTPVAFQANDSQSNQIAKNGDQVTLDRRTPRSIAGETPSTKFEPALPDSGPAVSRPGPSRRPTNGITRQVPPPQFSSPIERSDATPNLESPVRPKRDMPSMAIKRPVFTGSSKDNTSEDNISKENSNEDNFSGFKPRSTPPVQPNIKVDRLPVRPMTTNDLRSPKSVPSPIQRATVIDVSPTGQPKIELTKGDLPNNDPMPGVNRPSNSLNHSMTLAEQDNGSLRIPTTTESVTESTTQSPTESMANQQETQSPVEPATKDIGFVTSVAGDSFWLIAQRVYDDGRFFDALYQANKNNVESFNDIPSGTRIETPSAETLRKNWPLDCPREVYETMEGETLFDIAGNKLGQASRYVEILKINYMNLPRDLRHDTPLKAGIRLQLPRHALLQVKPVAQSSSSTGR